MHAFSSNPEARTWNPSIDRGCDSSVITARPKLHQGLLSLDGSRRLSFNRVSDPFGVSGVGKSVNKVWPSFGFESMHRSHRDKASVFPDMMAS